MSSFPEYERFDAVGLAELVRAGEVHPVELVDAAIARAERLDPLINAIVSRRFAAARAEAAAAPAGPFAGVPTLVKDLALEAGEPVSFGSVFFRAYRGAFTEEFMERFRRTGLVRLGRTNTPEFGLLPTTEPRLHGPTRNPWDLGRSAGGSSGGAAAAVAAGIVPLAHGSDGGGSIRIPASACGVFGLKPSRGRIPRRPPSPADYLSVELGLARSVRDLAVLLDAVAGPTPGEQYWAPPPRGTFRDAADRDPAPLRVAFTVRDLRGEPVHPECAAAVRDVAVLLESLGHEVVEAAPEVDFAAMAEAFLDVWASLAADVFRLVLEAASADAKVRRLRAVLGDLRTMRIVAALDRRRSGLPAFEPFTWELAERSFRHTQADLDAARLTLADVATRFGDHLEDHDVFLSPVLGAPPLPLGAIDQRRSWEDLVELLFRYVAFTPPANFSGLPAMSVPLAWSETGLPIGVHFMARLGDEETLLSLAGQLERARPWAGRRPPVAAAGTAPAGRAGGTTATDPTPGGSP